MLALGKRPATTDHRDLLLKDYVPVSLPKPPKVFGAERAVRDWGMLGNDRVGDCVFAGAAHEQMIFSGGHVQFTDAAVLSDYSAVTGYVPGDESTDQGTDVRDAMKYRRSTGVRDAQGTRHKIAAYAAIEPGDWNTLLTALWLFDAVGIGIEVPEYLMASEPPSTWRVSSTGRQDIIGGHYIPLVARRGTLRLVSWGRTYNVTKGFLDRYCDEAWVPFSEEMLDAGGKSPEGFNRDQLLRDLSAL